MRLSVSHESMDKWVAVRAEDYHVRQPRYGSPLSILLLSIVQVHAVRAAFISFTLAHRGLHMARSIAAALRDGLIAKHHEHTGALPTPSQRSGYAKVGSQVEKFVFQVNTVRDIDRCRQIICANIPAICKKHSLDEEGLRVELECMFMAFPDERLWTFYQQVLLHHDISRSPVAPSPGGCLIPFALVLSGLSLTAVFGYRGF